MKNYIYVHYYHKTVANKLLVIGLFRKWLGFKWFFYINLPTKLWRWRPGRQHGTNYKKFCMWSFRIWKFGFDAYILKYEANTKLNWHLDPVPGKHWRLNIKLKGDTAFTMRMPGGYNIQPAKNSRIVLFRPDLWEHKLNTFSKTLKLSFGFVKFK